MNWLKKLPGFTRTASGLEWVLWKKLPWIWLVGTFLPLILVGLFYLWTLEVSTPEAQRVWTQWLYIAIGVVVAHWPLVLTVGIGCVIVMLMKGPAFIADGFEVQHSDQPGSIPDQPPSPIDRAH
ncbi:hypothetical protein B9Z51_14380 [Limnohabitans sp. T6-5]|uniref:hypothetical protein n=1 Tax=Limnohabitans sp. T6-5 TaxID=1100724 RepID=UPI000D35CE16|nr:hypothetical protein [Limnohabitans sp. T6-5]PUE07294.1 hypothetical protein B9Z51_14380 [Limnohabitans sp. T6-5]